MSLDKKKVSKFLEDLTKLSHKHQMYINGCGCCGSPFIADADITPELSYTCDESAEYLTFRDVQR